MKNIINRLLTLGCFPLLHWECCRHGDYLDQQPENLKQRIKSGRHALM